MVKDSFNESERLLALQQLNILDTLPEGAYDDLTRLISVICDVPIALVSLVDQDRQWFKSKVGITVNETHRDYSFCSHCILGREVMQVPDASKDDRFKDNPLVTSAPHIRFYAGVPLVLNDGHAMGSLCVIASQPKELNEFQMNALITLGKQVSDQLELRRAHIELGLKHIDLEKAHTSLKHLFQVISHDLRSPFYGLLGVTELLAKEYNSLSTEDIQELLSALNESASETFILLENLLEWSNLERGELPFSQDNVEVSDLIHEATAVLSTRLKQKGERLIIMSPKGETVFVDVRMINSVLRNLVSNAIKFTAEGGGIAISTTQHASGVLVEISDNGQGMSAEQVEVVLGAGLSRSSIGTTGERGSGIGLMLVHEFLAKHGSKLEVESTIGVGTVIRFVLPTQ